ncbi:beta-microseminoprotein-like [Hyperolius riggenbachi]|uniref:beta-microseminoprotein-like n=1 Tax=Hyperolius riggenbachi TaxID=752182 RepID=UPI0035A2EF77
MIRHPELKNGDFPEGCLHEGQLHPLNTQWKTKDCTGCSCNGKGAMTCCTMGRPRETKHCKFRYHEDCSFDLIPNEECTSFVMVG